MSVILKKESAQRPKRRGRRGHSRRSNPRRSPSTPCGVGLSVDLGHLHHSMRDPSLSLCDSTDPTGVFEEYEHAHGHRQAEREDTRDENSSLTSRLTSPCLLARGLAYGWGSTPAKARSRRGTRQVASRKDLPLCRPQGPWFTSRRHKNRGDRKPGSSDVGSLAP